MYRIRLDSIRLSPEPHLPCSYLKSSAWRGWFPYGWESCKANEKMAGWVRWFRWFTHYKCWFKRSLCWNWGSMVRGQLSGKNVSNPHLLLKSPDSKPVLGTKNFAKIYLTGKKKHAFPENCVPSGNLWQFAIENGPVEIVDLPIFSMVDLSIVFLYTFTRG